MKLRICMILALFGALSLGHSQESQYTQYMYNTLALNAGYAGSRGVLSITALYRDQWNGLMGSPTTKSLTIHSPLTDRTGLGLSIVSDDIGEGTSQETDITIPFAYHLPVGENTTLALGLNIGGQLLKVDFNNLQNYTPVAGGAMNLSGEVSGIFGAGAYLYKDSYYLGLSVPNFLKTEHFDNGSIDETYLSKESFALTLMGGYVFDLNSDFKLKPAFLVRSVEDTPTQLDLSANIMYMEKFRMGASYRWDASVSALVGVEVANSFLVGFAYDWATTQLGNTDFSSGSFEILLRYEFRNRASETPTSNIRTPRFF